MPRQLEHSKVYKTRKRQWKWNGLFISIRLILQGCFVAGARAILSRIAWGEGEVQQKRKKLKVGVVLLALIWILLLAVSLYLLQVLLAMFVSNPQGQGLISADWSGYLVTSDLENPQNQVVGINASWTVPRIGVFSSDAYSSAWIGIGGHSEKTLIQTGTEQDSVNGQEYYSAWYELLPANAVRIDTISVSPGDVITASINLVNSNTDQWAIRIYDVTKGQGFYRTFTYNSSQLSADWVVERPHVNNQITPLANFGTIKFTGSYAKIGDTVGTIASFPYSQVIMTTDLSLQLTSVSSLGDDGASFNVTYLSSG